mgnify:CR=1 FL=1
MATRSIFIYVADIFIFEKNSLKDSPFVYTAG